MLTNWFVSDILLCYILLIIFVVLKMAKYNYK